MLYLIGLGLADVDDLTVKGLRIIKQCLEVYLETYTTILQIDQKTIEEHLGIKVIPADRELVELSAGKDFSFVEKSAPSCQFRLRYDTEACQRTRCCFSGRWRSAVGHDTH